MRSAKFSTRRSVTSSPIRSARKRRFSRDTYPRSWMVEMIAA